MGKQPNKEMHWFPFENFSLYKIRTEAPSFQHNSSLFISMATSASYSTVFNSEDFAMATSASSPRVIEEKVQELMLPSGYRFCPLDTQLVIHYLKKKILGLKLPADIIPTIDLYKLSPHQIPLSEFKYGMDNEWYFFSFRAEDNVTTRDGYWKNTCMDLEIKDGNEIIGFKKTLVFYWGIPPQAHKTNWILHEYSLNPHLFTASQLDDTIKNKNLNKAEVPEALPRKDVKELKDHKNVKNTLQVVEK